MNPIVPRVITPPASEPITLSQALDHLRVTSSEGEAGVAGMISAARIYCEKRLSKALLDQTLEIALDYWPRCGYIELPRAKPVTSVEFLKRKDSAGVETVMVEDTDFAVDYDAEPGSPSRIVPAPWGAIWPSFTPWPVSAIRCRYKAGDPIESPPVPFPANITQAMLMLVEHFYDNRSAVIVGENTTVQSALLEMGVDELLGIDSPSVNF